MMNTPLAYARRAAFVALLLALPAVEAAPPLESMTLRWLIDRSLERSPLPQIADREVDMAEQQRQIVRAGLLPQIGVGVTQRRETLNPVVLGFQIPGVPSLIGPYSVFDARLSVTQTVIDLARFSTLDAAQAALAASRAQADLERERLAAQVAGAFVGTLAAQAHLTSAQADVDLAQQLLTLARSRLALGMASGVDALRAESAVAQARFVSAEAMTALNVARLQLQDVSQLPLDPDAMELNGDLEPRADRTAEPASEVLSDAWHRRPEVRLMQAMLDQARAELERARHQRLPALSAFADYGLSAATPTQKEEDTYRFGVTLSVPLFAGGALRAGQSARELDLERQVLRLEELHRSIEVDVLRALATVRSTAEQVRAAEAALALASREVESARDRFAHGVADNLDVVSAQAALTRSRGQKVGAQAAYQQARLNLALARGQATTFDLEWPPGSTSQTAPPETGETP